MSAIEKALLVSILLEPVHASSFGKSCMKVSPKHSHVFFDMYVLYRAKKVTIVKVGHVK